jgi:hypothetical protein
LSIIEVWQKTEPKQAEPTPSGGEVWSNPHWWFDADWWLGSREGEQEGFLKGYLWCMRNRVRSQDQSYSRPVDYYADKISEYIKNHEKRHDGVYEKPIADILALYRDKPASKSKAAPSKSSP